MNYQSCNFIFIVYTSFINIPIVTIERGTVTFWHGIHSLAVLLNLLQPPWHPHQVKYLIAENVFCILFRMFCCCFFLVIARECALTTEMKEFCEAVSYIMSNIQLCAVCQAFKLGSKGEEEALETFGKFYLAFVFFSLLLSLYKK